MKRLLDFDPFTGIKTWFEKTPGDKEFHVVYEYTRDEVANVDHCRRLANDTDYTKRGIKQDWWHYAHVPASIMLKWHIEEGIPLWDARAYNQKVNEREWRALKVTEKWHDRKR